MNRGTRTSLKAKVHETVLVVVHSLSELVNLLGSGCVEHLRKVVRLFLKLSDGGGGRRAPSFDRFRLADHL